MRSKMLAVAALLVLAAPVASAADKGRWLHIRVDESGPGGEKVRVNVPLSMVETLLPLMEDDGDFNGGRIRLNDHDMDAVKLRAIWKAVREAEEGEFVTVESDDENVRVSRSGPYLHVNVQDTDDNEDVKVRIPTMVMDALLSGSGDELDLVAAIRALDDHGDGELIRVDSDDENVRIWVDASHSGEGSSK
jgi:hypothetical protein